MLPVYGLVQPLFEPLHDRLRSRPALVRAAVYAGGFTTIEYASGRLLRAIRGDAPWDYPHARLNLHGLVRPGYLPVWAAAGLGLERIHDRLVPSTRRPSAAADRAGGDVGSPGQLDRRHRRGREFPSRRTMLTRRTL